MATEAPFAWDDPLGLDEQLSEEERAVRDAAYDYCQSSLQPRIVLATRHERFDRQIVTAMGSLGFLGATLPEAYGGSQASHLDDVFVAADALLPNVLCNLEAVNTYEGAHDIHALILGRAQTGIAAFE